VKGKGLPRLWPRWGRWSYDKEFLPQSFHSTEGFEKFATCIQAIDGPVQWSRASAQSILLAIGLALRDIHIAHSPDAYSPDLAVPDWVMKTPWTERKILNFLKEIPGLSMDKGKRKVDDSGDKEPKCVNSNIMQSNSMTKCIYLQPKACEGCNSWWQGKRW
jgi:hypothetical protein